MNTNSCHSNTITEGLNGYNNYTFTTATFVIPALNNATPVTINVSNVRPSIGIWAAPGSIIFVDGNYLKVVSSTENSITVTNPANATDYTSNSAPGTVVPVNSLVVTAGIQGPPVTLPRRSVIIPTTLFEFPTPGTSGYQNFLTGTIPNYLTSEGDCLEIEYSVTVTGANGVGLKLILGGITVHELTDNSGTDGFRSVFHRIKIVRGSSNTRFSYISELKYTTNTGLGVTDVRPINARQLVLASSTAFSTAVDNLSVVGQVNIGGALGGSIGFFSAKFTPYDN